MSTKERVNKQIKALAANSKFLTSIIQENELAELQKNVDLLKQSTPVEPSLDRSDDLNTVCYSDKEFIFDSMLQITNFILYNDYPNESDCTSKQKYLQTSRCDYNLSKSDLKEIDWFAKELDTIQADLDQLHDHIKSYKKSYVVYCENLMRFIDQKELLMTLFLNYYDEYFLRRKQDKCIAKKPTRHTSENSFYPLQANNEQKRTRNRKNSVASQQQQQQKQQQRHSIEYNTHKKYKNDTGYISDDCCFVKQQFEAKRSFLRAAKSTTIYVSSIPTENRFAILNKINKQKTFS